MVGFTFIPMWARDVLCGFVLLILSELFTIVNTLHCDPIRGSRVLPSVYIAVQTRTNSPCFVSNTMSASSASSWAKIHRKDERSLFLSSEFASSRTEYSLFRGAVECWESSLDWNLQMSRLCLFGSLTTSKSSARLNYYFAGFPASPAQSTSSPLFSSALLGTFRGLSDSLSPDRKISFSSEVISNINQMVWTLLLYQVGVKRLQPGIAGVSLQHNHQGEQTHLGRGGGQHLHLRHRSKGQHQLRAVLHPPRQLPRHGPHPLHHLISPQHAAVQGSQEDRQHVQEDQQPTEERPEHCCHLREAVFSLSHLVT